MERRQRKLLHQLTKLATALLIIQTLPGKADTDFFDDTYQPSGFDPDFNSEAQLEGAPPVRPGGSARAVPRTSQALGWTDDNRLDEERQRATPLQPSRFKRSDVDEEELDEEDRDEAKSGTQALGSYAESPSYGESTRAAQDGDDIENFFDTHLGPQEARDGPAAAAEASEEPSSVNYARGNDRSVLDPEEDQFEAAASSPLSDIFHSIIHRRPLIITASTSGGADEAAASKPSAAGADTSGGQQAASQGFRLVAAESGSQASGSASSSDSIAGYPFTRGSPFLDAPQSEQTAPGYYLPVPLMRSKEQLKPEAAGESLGEVYMAPRSPLLFQGAQSSGYGPFAAGPMVQQPSNANWRGVALPDRPYEPAEQYPVAGSYGQIMAVQQQQQQLLQQPSAAAAEQSVAGSNQVNSNKDDEETVSYGLSFGSSGPSFFSGGSSVSADNSGQFSQQPAVERPQLDSSGSPGAMRHSASNSYYNNYGHHQLGYPQSQVPSYGGRAGYANQVYSGMPHGSYMQRQPSEMIGHPMLVNQQQQYQRLRNSNDNRDVRNSNWLMRQQLLAKVDQQLKSNPYYRNPQQQVEPSASSYLSEPGMENLYSLAQKQETAQSSKQVSSRRAPIAEKDFAVYKSFHSEQGPLKSFTSAAQLMVGEPEAENSQQTGRVQDPAPVLASGSTTSAQNPKESPASTGANRTLSSASSKSSGNPADKSTAQSKHRLASESVAGRNGSEPTQSQARPPAKARDILRHRPVEAQTSGGPLRRLKRDDVDDREGEDSEDDGVWVDDDDDDDNRQTATDVNETSQEPEEEGESQNQQQQQQLYQAPVQQPARYMAPAGYLGTPHGYELSHV